MQIISVPTRRGLVLRSVMYECEGAESVVILMSGICSNIFNNELLQTTGEILSQRGCAYIVGQAMDAFSLLHYSNLITQKQELKGVVIDDFDVICEDVDAYVEFAQAQGFKNIILAGHSLGSNKIIHYLSLHHHPLIKKFILTGPVDLDALQNDERKENWLQTAKHFVSEGRGEEILPFLYLDFSPMSAHTLLAFYENTTLKNCPFAGGAGETHSLGAISICGTVIIGEKDSCTGGNARAFAEKIITCTKEPQNNTIVIVPDAGHIFYAKHNEYAQEIFNAIRAFV
ncbi:DUF1749 domain-containing protein [Helicobacter sp. MIT 14-3879]|uniref:alpha/beta hydrolase n=1 Tax=Helicobacter sp. MIT 14-3879 TaxID=2040649 RepID=UPI000E1F428B|nr:DUF1749 domain-containing protein [Helicobacter sp. MIT 14-3879]RDU59068.1 hypothetical protein CQA44_11750 [Helicobacter sp. MIT 14-3879]